MRLQAAGIFLFITVLCLAAGLSPAGIRRTEAADESGTSSRDAGDEDPALEVSFPFETGVQPACFSWADQGKQPRVRSQEGLYTCWALCAVSAAPMARPISFWDSMISPIRSLMSKCDSRNS